jgi:nudix-type nucleoside diphosphatase (YffH/AdpP family)
MTDRYRPVARTVLSDDWGTLVRHEFDYRRGDGRWQRLRREVYDHGAAVSALLHDPEADTVLLVRQFRLPVHLTGGPGFFLEAPAGLLEGAAPEERMRAELMEETGYAPDGLERLSEIVASPGSYTERVICFLGRYDRAAPEAQGGGRHGEGEDIEIVHIPLDRAVAAIASGEIADAKTVIMLQALALRRAQGRPPAEA